MKKIYYLLLSLSMMLPGMLHAQVNPSFGEDDYKKALWMTTRFYGAQRSGHGPNWLIAEHEPTNVPSALQQYSGNFVKGKSFIKDADGSYDLTGGWFDCGDHVKFGQTLFYSAYMLILGYSEFPAGYDDHYSFNYEGYIGASDYTWEGKKGKPNGIPDILDEVKYATDYFLKAMRDESTFYYQVGNGDLDHKHWVTSSFMSALPKNEGGEAEGSRQIYKATGNATSMASFCGATLAAMARLYKPFDPEYAQACLNKAIVAYNFVKNTTKGNTGGGGYYGAKPKYEPDMVVLFAELYRTTKDQKYLDEAQNRNGAAKFMHDDSGWNHNFSLCYNNTEDLAYYLLASLGNTLAKERLGYYVNSLYKPSSGYFLNVKNDGWGVLRFPANQAFVLALYDKLNDVKTLNPYTLTSIEYIMGKNKRNFSYIVGFGQNHPKYPHHRNFFGEDNDSESTVQPKAKYMQLGYMTGGSLNDGEYNDAISQYTYSEGGIDYNAGLVGALGYLNSIINPVDINKFGHPTPDLGSDISICGLSSVLLDSKVAAAGQRTFTWLLDGNQVESSKTATTYNAVRPGEYTCVIDSAGEWQTQATVKVLDVLPDVTLGEDITLCNPVVFTLDATVESSVVTYQWYKDGALIKDATNPKYTVNLPGTYECEISATGCPSKSDEVVVYSKLPIVADATSDSHGNVTLFVDGDGEYEWYDQPEGGTLLGTGNSYTTRITQNKTFYVQDAGSASFVTGPSVNTFTGDGTNWGNIGAAFTAEKPFLITGLTSKPAGIYNSEPVSLTLNLQYNGNTIGTYTSKAVENKGTNHNYVLTFDPPIEVPQAGNYILMPNGGFTPLFYQQGPAYSSYSESGIIQFTGATNGTASNNPFPALFNWQIQAGSGCARALANAIYDPNGSVEMEEISSGICDIYPNPVEDIMYISLKGEDWRDNISVEIISLMGSVISTNVIAPGEVSSGINVSELKQGIYLVRLTSGNNTVVKQIIKK
jgi:hypothetical protein